MEFILASIIQFYVGFEFYRSSLMSLKNRIADMNLLVSIGTLSAYFYSTVVLFFENIFPEPARHFYFEASSTVITFVLIGRYLEERTKFKTTDFMKKLLTLKPKKALIVVDGKDYQIDAENIVKGDVVIIKPGDTVPVDGIVIQGQSEVDKSAITGESKPEFVKEGDLIISGSINMFGVLKIKAKKNAKESVINQIIDLLLQAQSKKPKIGRLADRITQYFVPMVLMVAIITFDLWYIFFDSIDYAFVNMVAVLVIACPCALGLATPIAVVSTIGRGSKEGIFIKNPEILENIKKIDIVIFDKTGTLTEGSMEVIDSMILKENLSPLASIEKDINHPISRAITKFLERYGLDNLEIPSKNVIPGEGILGNLEGMDIFAGNMKLLGRLNIVMDKKLEDFYHYHTSKGHTVIFYGIGKELIAVFAISDKIRLEAKQVISYLKGKGIKTVMLSGDNENVVSEVAKSLSLDEFRFNLSPMDKYHEVVNYRSMGKKVMFVGDGINDAPAMSGSDVGIAIGSGSDIAKESGDIILINTDLRGVIKAINLSINGLKIIKQNLFWAYIYNVIGIPLAAGLMYPFFGLLLNPVYAGLAMSFSSVTVVFNSLRLRFMKI